VVEEGEVSEKGVVGVCWRDVGCCGRGRVESEGLCA
jgi:hypothetical protein